MASTAHDPASSAELEHAAVTRPVAVRPEDLRVLRAGTFATVALLPGAGALAGAFAGLDGVVGAVLGVALVAAFFSVSMVLVNAAAKVSPMLMYQTAMATYLVKMLVLFGLLLGLRGAEFLSPPAFGFSILAATLVWLVAEVRLVLGTRVLYVNPEGG